MTRTLMMLSLLALSSTTGRLEAAEETRWGKVKAQTQHSDELPATKPAARTELTDKGALPLVATLTLEKGKLDFVQHADGAVGIGAVEDGLRAAGLLMERYQATPLEVFNALGGQNPPRALVQSHQSLVDTPPRDLPGLDELKSAAGGQKGPFSAEGELWGGACVSQDPVDFWGWFQASQLDHQGAQGESAHGEVDNNTAYVTMGTTSAGVVVFCGVGDEGNAAGEVRFQELWYNNIWIHIWEPGFAYSGYAYGYLFDGWHMRTIRLAVNDYDSYDEPFFWALSY